MPHQTTDEWTQDCSVFFKEKITHTDAIAAARKNLRNKKKPRKSLNSRNTFLANKKHAQSIEKLEQEITNHKEAINKSEQEIGKKTVTYLRATLPPDSPALKSLDKVLKQDTKVKETREVKNLTVDVSKKIGTAYTHTGITNGTPNATPEKATSSMGNLVNALKKLNKKTDSTFGQQNGVDALSADTITPNMTEKDLERVHNNILKVDPKVIAFEEKITKKLEKEEKKLNDRQVKCTTDLINEANTNLSPKAGGTLKKVLRNIPGNSLFANNAAPAPAHSAELKSSPRRPGMGTTSRRELRL